MKLSLVFELLLIFILLAFAASKSVKNQGNIIKKEIQNRNDNNVDVDKVEENSINKYCKCVESYCNCCRDFRLPVVELNGPGCASLMYLSGDKLSVSLSFGKKVITNRTLSSRKPSPVCMPLPGGVSKFCGRVYNIARAGEEFRACLGLELQSKRSVEAAVRVSCFKFGPRGVTSEAADPLPLVPQDEKTEDDDDDDDDYEDDDDDFGLGGDEDDDDDDDDDDGAIDAVNDVDGGDYTGFSLLGEDILGDLFGSGGSGSKKPKKSIKKQAPTTTTTTTTRRPRPHRRPSRKPSTRSTTPRPVRTSTHRSRPSRRPTRKPSRRPTRKPTTESTLASVLTTTTLTPVPSTVTAPVQTTERVPDIVNTIQESSLDPVSVIAVKPTMSVIPVTTAKTVTDFEDSGLEMSLAHITGQLSAMPVTPMISNEGKDSSVVEVEQPNYEKIPTITPKAPSTVAFHHSYADAVNDDMVQIVQNLESNEQESGRDPEGESLHVDESRGHEYNGDTLIAQSYFEQFKKNRENQFEMDDLDVLDLGKIGESLGDELGLFGNRKNRDNKDTEVQGENEHTDDYDDLVDALGHTLMMNRRSDNNINKNKKNRKRQNKMMRGEWSSQPMAS